MRLRNIFRMKDKNIAPAMLHRFLNSINNGDTIICTAEFEYEKIPLSAEDLINRNMDLIEKLLERKKDG